MFGKKQIAQVADRIVEVCEKLLPELFYKFEVQREINVDLQSQIDANAFEITNLKKELESKDEKFSFYIQNLNRDYAELRDNVNKESDDTTRQE